MKVKLIIEVMDSRFRGNDIVDGRLELTKIVIKLEIPQQMTLLRYFFIFAE
jgi:hypothetical protein